MELKERVNEFVEHLAEDIRPAVAEWDGLIRRTGHSDQENYGNEPVFAEKYRGAMECFGFGYAGFDEFWAPYFKCDKEKMLESLDFVINKLKELDNNMIVAWGLDEEVKPE